MAGALIVDFGGVLTTNVFESFRAFSEAEGLDPEAVRKLFRERGELEIPEFEQRFGPLLGVRENEGMVQRLFAGVRADDRMVDAVRRVKESGRPTGLISNSWGGASYDRVEVDDLFDAVVISGEVGLHKPEPEIFRLGAERLGVAPEECVFVDDLRENCEGAEAVGMTAILHRGPDGTIPELERLLGLELA
ncbi:MAG: putative hydrolase of the superfamily [Solirubrobacteraceae bacterium]|nr:putative hydrolase of the superfamily [Solirubrobacteraceae bacterium]